MSKFSLYLAILLIFTVKSAPELNVTLNEVISIKLINSLVNNVYLFNFSNQAFTTTDPTVFLICNDSSTVLINNNSLIACFAKKQDHDEYAYYLDTINPLNPHQFITRNLIFASTSYFYPSVGGDYIVLNPFLDSTAVIYYTLTNGIVCKINTGLTKIFVYNSIFNGKHLIYPVRDESINTLYVFNCTHGLLSKQDIKLEYLTLLAVNQSDSIIVAGFREIYAIKVNESGQIEMGANLSNISFEAYNSSNFLYQNLDEELFTIYLGTLDENIQFVDVETYSFPFAAKYVSYWNSVTGSSQITINITDEGETKAIFDYDLVTGEAFLVQFCGQPYYLSNGSVVNMTVIGYFIQSPGEPAYLIYAPSQVLFQNLANPVQFWGFFIQKASQGLSAECNLITMDTSTSYIASQQFANCPFSSSILEMAVKDVAYDEEGNVYLAYTDGLGNLYIVTNSSDTVYGPYNFLLLPLGSAVILNPANQTAIYVAQEYFSSVQGNFYIQNGSVYQKTTINSTINIASAYARKLNQRYVFLAGISSGPTTIIIWDSVDCLEVSNLSVTMLPIQMIVPLGVGQDENIVSGFAILMRNPISRKNEVFVFNMDGTSAMVNIPYQFRIVSLQLVDENSFFVVGVNVNNAQYPFNNQYLLQQINITDWDLMSTY